jgi:serine/threonine protein kinase
MPIDPDRVQAIFTAAAEQPTPADRAAVLDQACGRDLELRRRVEALLAAHDAPASFLEAPVCELDGISSRDMASAEAANGVCSPGEGAFAPLAAPEGAGCQIGPYKLLHQIGEGGMGTVFMAEQSSPVHRKVALKIIRPGMDSRHVIARFEAERQALALMDHPNIARVLDAGTTEAGRPYFVMELVKGIPITRYCDERQLTPRERLELFIPVCQAVQHAHQKGVIHRDLKPSNVLIALYDGKPVPKVIDFGVAKATGPKLTERTLHTDYGAIVGTLEYMSPEQAELNQLDVDTRSDVYSLGVLIYELLTGSTPLEPGRLRDHALLDVLRIIREDEPPRPSTRLSTTDGLASIAANRNVEPHRLTGLVRGELDWIVMKALEKDRNRRYATASSLALDLRRYLDDEPVLACPPSAWYHLGKVVRRNVVALAVAALVSLSLLGALIGLAVSNVLISRANTATAAALKQAKNNESRAKIEAEKATSISELLLEMFTSANPDKAKGAGYTVRELLDSFSGRLDALHDQPEVEAALHRAIGMTYRRLGVPDKAGPHLQAALDLRRRTFGATHPHVAESLVDYAWSLPALKRHAEAETLVREAIAIYKSQNESPKPLVQAFWALLWLQVYQGKHAEAEETGREAIALTRVATDGEIPELANLLHTLADSNNDRRLYSQAEPVARDAVALHRKLHGPDHPETGWGLNALGRALLGQGRPAEAKACFREALTIFRKHYGPEYKVVAQIAQDLAAALSADGDRAGLKALRRELLMDASGHLDRHRDDPAAWLRRAIIRADLDEWDAMTADLDQVAKLGGKLPHDLRAELGGLIVGDGVPPAAALSLARCLEADPADHWSWYLSSTLRLASGDTPGYRRACREMLERFGQAAEPEIAERTAKMCLLAPDSAGENHRAQELARHAVTGTEKHPSYAYFLMAKGLAEFRAGRYPEVVERLNSFTQTSESWSFEASALAILAMAQARLGKPDPARAALEKSQAILKLRKPPPDQRWTDNWHDWLHAQILCREAEHLLKLKR